MIEFEGFGKIARLNRDIVITEKIDGTNAAIIIVKAEDPNSVLIREDGRAWAFNPGNVNNYHARAVVVQGTAPDFEDSGVYFVGAQSRKQLITPEQDNFGFARWVFDNAAELVRILGEGRHFGEWWGSGIQRGYGLEKGRKVFSLFNVARYGPVLDDEFGMADAVPALAEELRTVEQLYRGPFSEYAIKKAITSLMDHGSLTAPGFMRPEGIVIWHEAARQLFKVTLENDEAPKSLAGQ